MASEKEILYAKEILSKLNEFDYSEIEDEMLMSILLTIEKSKQDTKQKVKEIIKSWWNNQPKNRTEKSIDELLKEVEKI